MRDYTVVVDDCATPEARGIVHVRTRPTDYGQANFTLRYDSAVIGLGSPLTSGQQDWLHLLGCLFAADLACARGAETEWNRRIDVHIPVRDPARWQAMAPDLSDLFAELTYDELGLTFYRDGSPPDPPRQRRTRFGEFDAVALFSGGMDSFAGAAQLVADGRVPALVTHSTGSAAPAAVRYLQGEIQKLGDLGPLMKLTAQRRGQTGTAENSQRSRSLLFLGLAAVVAAASGVEDVYINENGVMAVHAPMTAARVGSLSTRTASPKLVDAFAAVARTALEAPSLQVHNILQRDTKPEVAGRAVSLGVGHCLANTVSCWSIARNSRHCGYCAPCLIRRISMETHGVVDALYDHNPFDGERSDDPVAHDNLVQLLMLAQDLINMDGFEVQLDYPELLNTGASMSIEDSMAMHRRWGEQAIAVARAHSYSASLL